MNLFPNLSPLWYAVPMVLLLTAQLIILFYRYLPMAKKDYAPHRNGGGPFWGWGATPQFTCWP